MIDSLRQNPNVSFDSNGNIMIIEKTTIKMKYKSITFYDYVYVKMIRIRLF